TSQVRTTDVELPAEMTSGASKVNVFEPVAIVGALVSDVPRLPSGRTRQSLSVPALAPPPNERLIGSAETWIEEFELAALSEMTASGVSCAPGRTTGVVPSAR